MADNKSSPHQFTWMGRLKPTLDRFESAVDIFQILLSVLAVTLVVANEFVVHTFTVPYLDMSWEQLQITVRGFTWTVFVFDFVLYGLASGRPFSYARRHWLELVVCFTWVPYYDASILKHVSGLLSLDVLTLIGSLVHTWLVTRWTIRRFRAHPHIVITAITVVLIVTGSAVLMRVEPETFKNWNDALWFSIQTVFTIGYGDIPPKTDIGRAIASLMIVCGVGVIATFIALMQKMISSRLLPEQHDDNVKLIARVDQQNKLISELIEENRRTNETNRQLLEELKSRSESKSGSDS